MGNPRPAATGSPATKLEPDMPNLVKNALKRRLRRLLNRLAPPNHRTTTITVRQTRFEIPCVDGARCRPNEPWMEELLGIVLPSSPGTFLDVGVNLGQTLLKVRAIDPARRYVGFEPNPFCVFYLDRLISANRLTDCRVLPVGLSDETAVVRLVKRDGDPASAAASIVDGFRGAKSSDRETDVPVFLYGELPDVTGGTRVGVIKIDVEGAESQVLTGLRSLIADDEPVVLLEVLPTRGGDSASRVARQGVVERLMTTFDFGIARVVKSTDGRFAGIESVEGFGSHTDLTMCDYVCGPAPLLSRIAATAARS